MNKFKKNDRVQFKGNDKVYLVVRFYKSGKSYKYDVASIDGKETVIAMNQSFFKKVEKK